MHIHPLEMRQLIIALIIVALMNNSDGQQCVSCNDGEYILVS